MSFSKGMSGNKAGRPKQTAEQKSQKERFEALLRASTISALESIITIAQDRFCKDRFQACKFIIEKAYGANIAFLLDGEEEKDPIVIKVVSCRQKDDEEREWEDE